MLTSLGCGVAHIGGEESCFYLLITIDILGPQQPKQLVHRNADIRFALDEHVLCVETVAWEAVLDDLLIGHPGLVDALHAVFGTFFVDVEAVHFN